MHEKTIETPNSPAIEMVTLPRALVVQALIALGDNEWGTAHHDEQVSAALRKVLNPDVDGASASKKAGQEDEMDFAQLLARAPYRSLRQRATVSSLWQCAKGNTCYELVRSCDGLTVVAGKHPAFSGIQPVPGDVVDLLEVRRVRQNSPVRHFVISFVSRPSALQRVTVQQARDALDNMDDYARMDAGVDAIGARGVLERFIEEAQVSTSAQPPLAG